jgi:hypothetical protein
LVFLRFSSAFLTDTLPERSMPFDLDTANRFYEAARDANAAALAGFLASDPSLARAPANRIFSEGSPLLALLASALSGRRNLTPDPVLACAELLKPLSDPSVHDFKLRTALSQAAALGDPRLVRLFLDWSPDHADADGRNPLHFAAEAASPECVELLLPRFSGKAWRQGGRDALMCAAGSENPRAGEDDCLVRCVELLLPGADLQAREDGEGDDALTLAARAGRAAACRALLPHFDPLRIATTEHGYEDGSNWRENAAYLGATSGCAATLEVFAPALSRAVAAETLERALYECATREEGFSALPRLCEIAVARRLRCFPAISPLAHHGGSSAAELAIDEALAAAVRCGCFAAANVVALHATRDLALAIAAKRPKEMAPFLARVEAEALRGVATAGQERAAALGEPPSRVAPRL